MTTFSSSEKFKYAMDDLTSCCQEFPWENMAKYADFISQTYYYVLHSTRLLAAAAARFRIDQFKLHRRFLSHSEEEVGHHTLAERDLAAIGRDLASHVEKPITAAFYQRQYYLVDYQCPSALLGYILMLEGVAVVHGPHILERCVAAYGSKACSFLKLHVGEDPKHLREAINVLDTLTKEEFDVAMLNFLESCQIYKMILEQIRAD